VIVIQEALLVVVRTQSPGDTVTEMVKPVPPAAV
jgi:hypothetical protein